MMDFDGGHYWTTTIFPKRVTVSIALPQLGYYGALVNWIGNASAGCEASHNHNVLKIKTIIYKHTTCTRITYNYVDTII